jgi:hypothetical protein
LDQVSKTYDQETFAKALGHLDWDKFSETYDQETFADASGHLDWDTTMNEEYRSLMENNIWDLVPLLKG